MTAYEHFASLYDELMKEAPYEEWVKLVHDTLAEYHVQGKKLMDLGCGTGELSIRLAQDGLDITGVDLSDDMLSIAEKKAQDLGISIKLYEQDMSELDLPDLFDIIVIFCDSLNYLENQEKVVQTFMSVYDHLKPQGLFLFDVHTPNKVNQGFIGHDFCDTEEELAYIWECFEGPEPYSVYHDLTFFVKKASGLFERFEETHIQRTYQLDEYKSMLRKAGFDLLKVTADFNQELATQAAERWFFTATKK